MQPTIAEMTWSERFLAFSMALGIFVVMSHEIFLAGGCARVPEQSAAPAYSMSQNGQKAAGKPLNANASGEAQRTRKPKTK